MLRQSAKKSSLMTHLNQVLETNIITTHEVKLSGPHVKLLAGNYLAYKIKADQSGWSPRSRICTSGSEEFDSHVISTCQASSEQR